MQQPSRPNPQSNNYKSKYIANLPKEEPGCFSNFFAGVLTVLSYILLVIAFPFCLYTVKEYERGVIFRLGRLVGAKGPGLFILLPFIDRMVKVDLRVVTFDVTKQEVITKDSVTVEVNAVVYFRVVNPINCVLNVCDHKVATYLLAQTTLRGVLGQSDLDELLSKRAEINKRLKRILDEETDPWGVQVQSVEIKDVQLPLEMQRAMASQAEAERERRAKITLADGEFQASTKLAEAARVMSKEPQAIQLRFLQTLVEIAAENNKTVIFPLPVDLLKSLFGSKHPSLGGAEKDSQKDTKDDSAKMLHTILPDISELNLKGATK